MVPFSKSGIVQKKLGAAKKLEAWRITSNLLVYCGGGDDISMETKVWIGENCKDKLRSR